MPASMEAPGARLARLWSQLSPLPGGRWLFSRILGFIVPYTGSIRPQVRALEPGFAQVALKDRRAVRQHLGSVHAVALVNLAEVTSGLAMMVGLPPGIRGIVTRLSIEYFKKARGTLVAESRVTIPAVSGTMDYEVTADISDQSGTVVARATVLWRLQEIASAPRRA